MNTVFLALKIFCAVVGSVVVVCQLAYWLEKLRLASRTKSLQQAILDDESAPQFTKNDIKSAIDGYVEPDCSQADPANEADISNVADVREAIFKSADRYITHSEQRRHQLILADSGMGKTSFCLNFYHHLKKHRPDMGVVLVSLAQPDALVRIKKVRRQSSTIAILDALDEDPKAIQDGYDRIYDVLQACADFKSVIITCRSQFFPNDAAIPNETGVSIVTPRMAGQNSSYRLWRLYLSPFNEKQIKRYIDNHFKWWNPTSFVRRRQAHKLVSDVRELAARPMLLELLPSLIKDRAKSNEIYDLYDYMIQKWLLRESSWIKSERLLAVSKELAVYIHTNQVRGGRDRVAASELNMIALDVSNNEADWSHLTTRSLLNRDGVGYFKFAHRSIMEFLFVQAAIEGESRCLEIKWTAFMKQLLVSWGYSERGVVNDTMAQRILRSDLSQTALLPLSEPPTGPSIVGAPDFEFAASRRIRGSGNRRSAPARWRTESFLLSEDKGFATIKDLDSNLSWRFLTRKTAASEGILKEYLQKIGLLQKLHGPDAEFRLPSFAEFVTLVEGLDAINRGDVVPDGDLYLLSDKLGDKRNIAVRLGTYSPFPEMLTLDKARPIIPTKRVITSYEFGIYVNPSVYQSMTAVGLGVKVGLD